MIQTDRTSCFYLTNQKTCSRTTIRSRRNKIIAITRTRMLKIDNSVFVLFVISVLCAVYFSLFSIPLFSTGKKTPSAVVKIEKKVQTLEVQVKAIMDILGMKVKAGDKGKGGEKVGEGKEGEGKEGEGKEGEEKEGEKKGAEKSEKEKTGTGMSGMPGMPNI